MSQGRSKKRISNADLFFKPVGQISKHFLSIQFVKQLVPTFGVKMNIDIFDFCIYKILRHFANSVSHSPDRIPFAAYEQNRKGGGNPFQIFRRVNFL